MINTGAGAVGAGAASRYGSGSDQKMRLLASPAPQHWFLPTSTISEILCYVRGFFVYGDKAVLKKSPGPLSVNFPALEENNRKVKIWQFFRISSWFCGR
jgi:hypothetical protein